MGNADNKNVSNERNSLLDIVKAIMILAVVIYHLIYRKQAGVIDRIIREFIYISIPLFVLLAGYFHREKGGPLILGIGRRMKKIALPSILTTGVMLLVFGPYYMMVHGYTTKDWLCDSLMNYLRPEMMATMYPDYTGGTLFNNLSPVWFIWALVFATLVFVIALRIVRGKGEEAGVKGMIIAMVILVVIGSILYAVVPALSWSLQMAPLYAGIMMLGLIIRKCNLLEKLENINLGVSTLIMLALWALHFVIFTFIGSDLMYMSVLGKQNFITAIFFVIEVLMGGYVFFTFARYISLAEPLKDAFSWIGRHTLVILLVHCLIGGITADILHTYNKPGPDWYVNPLPVIVVVKSWVTFIVSMAGSIGLALLNDKLKTASNGRKK